MKNVIRAWKDEAYGQSLSVEEQAILPANPAGELELTEAELEAISGANFGGSFSIPFDNDTSDSRTQQIVTFEPILGGAATTFAPTAPQCNNLVSPASSSSNLFDFF